MGGNRLSPVGSAKLTSLRPRHIPLINAVPVSSDSPSKRSLTMDERMDDVRAVMDAAKARSSAAVLGRPEGGSLATLFAAHYPERCQALVNSAVPFAKFRSWLPTPEKLDRFFDYVEEGLGNRCEYRRLWAPAKKDDLAFREWVGAKGTSAPGPAAVMPLIRMNSMIDNISGILPYVRVPTARHPPYAGPGW